MATEDCLRIIREAAGDLSDDEIEEVVSELQRRLDARKTSGALETLEEDMLNAADELAREVVEAAQIEKRNRLINIQTKSRLLAFADEVDLLTGNPALALTAIDVGANRRFPGSRLSVDARGNALETEYLGGMIAELRKADLLPHFNSREIELDIARELEQLTRSDGRPGLTENKAARDIAKIIDDIRKAAVARENRAGAWIKPLPGYITRQAHDMARIRRAGFDAWRDFILPRLDPRTFDGLDQATVTPNSRSMSGEAGGATISSSADAPPATQFDPDQVSTRPEPSGSSTSRASTPPILTGSTTTFTDFRLGDIDTASSKKIMQGGGDIKTLHATAVESDAEFASFVKDLAADIEGAEFSGTRVKDLPGLQAKIAAGRGAETIPDIMGGRVTVDGPDAFNALFEALGARGRLLEIDDFISEGKNGYRATHVQIDLGNGMSAEVQIVPREIRQVQGRAHAIRQPWKRETPEKLSAEELARFKADMEEIRKLFDDAWRGVAETWGRTPRRIEIQGAARPQAPEVPSLPPKRGPPAGSVEKFLRGAYDGLVTGLHLRANGGGENDALFAFKGPGNLAKRASEHRVLHFKSADDWFAYNQRFGRNSLAEGILGDLRRAARNTALMEAYGTNPVAMRETVLDALREKHRSDVKKFDRLSARSLRNQFAEITGETAIPVNPSTANFNASVRAVKSMASLGGAFLSSFADLGLKAVELQRQGGRNLFQVWGANLTSTLEGMAPGERRAAADLIGVGLEGQIGDVAARFSATDDLPGRFAKAQQLFFKINLLAPWTDANKRGIGLMMARDLAMQKRKSFDALPDQTRSLLESYGIDSAKWELAKQAIRKEADGREYLMPDAIRDLDDEALGASGRAAQKVRDEVETALRSYYVDRADFAVPTPGARERAILRQGTQPGTAVGEAVRYVAQFKAFPVTVLTKVAGGLLESDSARQFAGNLVRGKGDILGLVHMMVATTVLGYVAQSAKELSKGRTPRDPESPATWTAAMLQGGGLGIFGDFMFGEFNRFGRTALETFAGPVPSEVGGLVEILDSIRRGEDAGARGLRAITNNTPFINLFYTRAAMEYLFLFQLQESMNPGYLRRMERRIAKENGQTFVLPPSQAIPRGGGDRVLEGVR